MSALADLGGSETFVWSPIASGPVPPRSKGHWCILSCRAGRRGEKLDATRVLELSGGGEEDFGPRYYMSQVRRPWGSTWRTIGYVPASSVQYRVYGRASSRVEADVRFTPVHPLTAAGLIVSASMRSVPHLMRALITGGPRHARAVLALTAASTPPPVDYQEWQQCFDVWPTQPPPGAAGWPPVSALVFHRDPGRPLPLGATMASLAAQALPMEVRVVAGPASAQWRAAVAALPGQYIAVVQAGEILPPHAAWAMASELHRLGRPELAFGDEDRLNTEGLRVDPLFRPEPNRALMLSGTQTRGVWFVRRDVLQSHPDGTALDWAEALRLDLWLRRHEAGHGGGHRVPIVLTHRLDATEAAPAGTLAELVDGHLARTNMPLAATPTFPVKVHCTRPARDRVSILVPSRLRTPLALRSILSILQDLGERDYELVVGVSQPDSLDDVQSAAAAKISAHPRGRVERFPFPSFNFSEVCNALAAMTTGQHILLLNDDVSVIRSGWLDEMMAHLADPHVAIVGAKLLYPDRSVQHGGVIIGLNGLCDHMHRHLPAGKLDPAARVSLAQELSAVTAACLLVRRSVFDAVGGLDRVYPSAFNDVDFCLRVREAGHRIVYAPAAELMHHELQTYGSHYHGERAPFQATETARMRRRWASLLAHDPFHNPNLELVAGREWQPSFPPRFALRIGSDS